MLFRSFLVCIKLKKLFYERKNVLLILYYVNSRKRNKNTTCCILLKKHSNILCLCVDFYISGCYNDSTAPFRGLT